MRILKPSILGCLHRTLPLVSGNTYVVKPLLFFDIKQPDRIISEKDGWSKLSRALPQNQALDEVMPKPSSEILFAGKAHQPAKIVSESCSVSMSVGDVRKTLSVTGNRIWQRRFWKNKASRPAPFSSMPITWENSFGYPASKENPIGVGTKAVGSLGETSISLPNIEYLDDLLDKFGKNVSPAGYGPLQSSWAPRKEHIGTFDQGYVDNYFPSLPPDASAQHYFMAPSDQRTENFLTGNEEYCLKNLHPELPIINGRLPGLCARCFVDGADGFEELATRLETLWFFPEVDLGVMIFCATKSVESRHAPLVLKYTVCGFESMLDQPRAVSHYKEAVTNRFENRDGAFFLANEFELCPLKSHERIKNEANEKQEEINRLNLINGKALEQFNREQAGQNLKALDPVEIPKVEEDFIIPQAALKRGDFDFTQILKAKNLRIESAQRQQLDKKKELEALSSKIEPQDDLEARAAARSVQYAKYPETRYVNSNAINLKEFSESDIQKLTNGAIEAKKASLGPSQDSYIAAAYAGDELREYFQELLDTNAGISFRDFSGLNGVNLKVQGKAFAACIFECANFSNIEFDTCTFGKTSFVAANLDGAIFKNCSFKDCNFSSALAVSIQFLESSVADCVYHKSHFRRISFVDSVLHNVKVIGSQFCDCKLERSRVSNSIFMNSTLGHSEFVDTDLHKVIFQNVSLYDSYFESVASNSTVFLDANLQLIQVKNSTFTTTQYAGKSIWTLAYVQHSKFEQCSLRGGVGFGIVLKDCYFSKCDMSNVMFNYADFSGTYLLETMMLDSDCAHSKFNSAVVYNSNLTGSNLCSSDLEGASFPGSDILSTNLDQSNFTKADNLMPLKSYRLQRDR